MRCYYILFMEQTARRVYTTYCVRYKAMAADGMMTTTVLGVDCRYKGNDKTLNNIVV